MSVDLVHTIRCHCTLHLKLGPTASNLQVVLKVSHPQASAIVSTMTHCCVELVQRVILNVGMRAVSDACVYAQSSHSFHF